MDHQLKGSIMRYKFTGTTETHFPTILVIDGQGAVLGSLAATPAAGDVPSTVIDVDHDPGHPEFLAVLGKTVATDLRCLLLNPLIPPQADDVPTQEG